MDQRRTITDDVEERRVAEEVRDLISRIVDKKLREYRPRGSSIRGQVPKSSGGTGTTTGSATPTLESITNDHIAEDADIDPAKFDPILFKTAVFDIMVEVLQAGSNITLDIDSLLETITINGDASPIPPPPDTYVYLVDDDGAYIIDGDGAYLWEPA